MLMKKLFGATLALIGCNLFAASFDCMKAENPIEKMICSNNDLSEWDDKLSRHFKNAMARSKNSQLLIREQRKWIADERNKCTDISCLNKSYTLRIALLDSKSDNQTKECPITEKNLLGTWIRSGAGDFEEMAFDVYENKRTFTSWLHHHPEMNGTWVLQDCQLHIVDINNEKISFDYNVKKYANGSLHLQEADSTVLFAYKKTK